MRKKSTIEFYTAYTAVNPPENAELPYEVDVIDVPKEWSIRKVRNKFKRRNPEWNFKKKAWIAKHI